MIIAVDFDGTCCKTAFPGIGEEMPECSRTLLDLIAEGHTIIIWTCRTGAFLEEVKDWLAGRGIFPEHFNCNAAGIEETFLRDFPGATIGRKIFADVYVDDKNLGGFPGWNAVRHCIRDMCLLRPGSEG